jgi:hypothetical protein
MRAVRTDPSTMRAPMSDMGGRVASLPTACAMIGAMITWTVARVGLPVTAARLFEPP